MGLGAIPRHIWVIRHGKSAHGAAGVSDHDRSLNDRGLRDGDSMQAWLQCQAHPAQWVWSSSALRARQTADYVCKGFCATLVEESDLYLASADQVIECLRNTPEDMTSVAIVAHNPGLTHLTNLLGPETVTDNLPTFGTALFRTHAPWHELRYQCAELISLHTPKTI